MSNEVFTITPNSVQRAAKRLESHLTPSSSLVRYVSSGLNQIERQQRLFFGFLSVLGIRVAFDTQVFSLAAVTGYNMVPDVEKTRPLTRDQIDAYAHSVTEHMRPSKRMPGMVEFEATWMLDKLEPGSPAFVEWVRNLRQIASLGEKSDIHLGILSTTMPFYLRAESKRLEQTFRLTE